MLGAAPRWFVEGTRVGGATAYAPPGATIGGEYTSPGTRAPRGFAAQGFRRPGVSPLAMVHRAYSPAGYPMRSNTGGPVHPFGPGGPFGGRMPLRPGGSPAQGFALGYGPAALQAAPGTCIRYGHSGLWPVWRAYAIRPYRGTCIRVPSGTRIAFLSRPRSGFFTF